MKLAAKVFAIAATLAVVGAPLATPADAYVVRRTVHVHRGPMGHGCRTVRTVRRGPMGRRVDVRRICR